MKSKDQQLLEEAYLNTRLVKEQSVDDFHNRMMKDETASNEKDDFSFLQQIAERMYDIGSRISSGITTPDDADFLRDSAVEIEKMVGKFGAPERDISEEEDEQMIAADLANKE